MAGASMNDIKARIKSVESTMQITKAMELVATSKLRRAKEKAERTRPFYEILGKSIDDVLAHEDAAETPWCDRREGGKTLYIVVAGDRGLAGGYNANIFRLTEQVARGTDAVYLPVGKKSLEFFRHRSLPIATDAFEYLASLGVGDAIELGKMVSASYAAGEYSRVVIIYTRFVSMLTQAPVYEQLLPLEREASAGSMPESDIDPIELLDAIVPAYVGGVIYSALTESLASEQGARRTAMNAANKNAAEMIDTLMLRYNRARQAIITQEITEIVSGAEAL